MRTASFRLLAGAALVFLALPASAEPMPISRIFGKWCGTVTSYTFTRNSMTVAWYADKTRIRFKVTKILPREDFLDVHWIRNNEAQNTIFAKFSADGRSMAQLANTHGDMGPERPFRRCK